MKEDEELLQVDLIGKNPILFEKLFDKLEATVVDTIEKLTDAKLDDTTRETIDDLVSATNSYISNKLRSPGLENDKILAEISKLYAEVEEKLASTREKKANTEKIELENIEKRIEIIFKTMDLMEKIELKKNKEGLLLRIKA